MNIFVDVNHTESDQSFRLCRLLGNDLAEVLPIRLWAWAIKTERSDGTFVATEAQLAAIVRWTGESESLSRAMIECGFLERIGDTFRIKGWDRNKQYFKERKRLQNRYKTKKSRGKDAGKTRESPVTDPGKSRSSSSSSSSSLDPPSGDLPQPPTTTREALEQRVSATEASKLWEQYRTEMQARGVDLPLVMSSAQLAALRGVVVLANGDTSRASKALSAFVRSDHDWWVKHDHALHMLAQPRDFERAEIQAGRSTPPKPKRRDYDAEMRASLAEADEDAGDA